MSPLDADDLPRLLERLYDAALDRDKWQDFLNTLPQSFGSARDDLAVPLFNDRRDGTAPGIAPHVSLQAKYSKKKCVQLERLTPHLMRGAEINRLMAGARRLQSILDVTLDALGRAAFVLDRHGKVLDANAHARALMRSEDRPVHVDRFRVLHAAQCGDDRAFSARLAAIACATQRALLPLRLVSNRTGTPYLAWLLPIASPSNGAPGERQPVAEAFSNEPAILLLASPARRSAVIPPEAIQAAFGLSAAEARLASALVAGHALGDYAARTGLSRSTVRNQLRAVFDRIGTRQRAEVAAIIVDALGLVGERAN